MGLEVPDFTICRKNSIQLQNIKEMATVVIMPKQGQSVESCIISSIVKKGDTVKKGDILFAYETDKASFEEESQVDGVVLECLYAEGDEVPVLTNVMAIGQPGEDVSALMGASAAPAPAAEAAPAAAPQVSAEPQLAPAAAPAAAPVAEINAGGEKFISPRARHLAEKESVNLDLVAGTGPQGRIIERDIEAAVAAGNRLSGKAKAMMADGGLEAPAKGSGLAGTVKASDLKVAKPNHTDIAGEGEDFDIVKMSNMRKLIAKSMYNSLQNSAQLTHHLGADARRIQALRKKAKKALEEGKIKVNVTINDLVCYAVIKALQKFPNVNSHCLGESMRVFRKVHLGLAVDTERGLMVPCVKNADDLSITGLSAQLKKVADDCKKGSINPDLLSSEAASFTVSNLGNYGVEVFTPIINVPQSAILGVNTIVPRPKDLGGGVYAFVPYIGLSLTYDHRSLDGGEATRFLKQVAVEIENLDVDFEK